MIPTRSAVDPASTTDFGCISNILRTKGCGKGVQAGLGYSKDIRQGIHAGAVSEVSSSSAAPRVIGIDEVSLRKGHTYRIVVSDLERRRPIWFGGKDRSKESLDIFYQWLGSNKVKKIRLAVMDMWKESLKWQRLKPYEKFAEMIEKHWDGIAAYSKPENKVSLGFVEGLNNKIRVIQKRAYGLRDEEYLRLKVLTCMLEEI